MFVFFLFVFGYYPSIFGPLVFYPRYVFLLIFTCVGLESEWTNEFSLSILIQCDCAFYFSISF